MGFALVGQPAAAQAERERTVGKVLKHRASGRRRKQPRTERLPGVSGSEGQLAEGAPFARGWARCAPPRGSKWNRRMVKKAER